MSPSKILFFLCISFVIGILIESIIKIPAYFLWGFLFLNFSAIIASLFLQKNTLTISGFCLIFLILGILRVQISDFNIANDKLSKFNGKGQVILTGVVSDAPDVRDTSQKIKVKVGNSTILVTTGIYPEYKYLDKIKLTGKLETPNVFDDFNYKNYLLKDHIYSVMNSPKIEIIGNAKPDPLSFAYSGVLLLKQNLKQSIENIFLAPQNYILRGILLGDKSSMPDDLKNQFSTAGLSYMIAVSGMHVLILSAILMSVLLALGFWRGQAFYFSAFLIFIYVLITGLPASGIRAGIMGVSYLLAQKLGRQNLSSRFVVLAAALMLLANPLLLIYDVGFQLSFLAVLGIIYLGPTIKNFLNIIFKDNFKILPDILAMTFSAQIFTIPIMIFNFGNVSLVASITSILVIPVFPEIMSFGFLSSLAGIIWPALGWILSVPCYFLLSYFMWIINLFSQPWMAKPIKNVSWIWLLASYLIIVSSTWLLNKKFAPKFL